MRLIVRIRFYIEDINRERGKYKDAYRTQIFSTELRSKPGAVALNITGAGKSF